MKIFVIPASLKGRFIYPLSNSGSILIIVVWMLLILSFFCITLGYIVSQKLNVAGHIKDRVLSYYLAKAAIQLAIEVLDNDETEYDSLNDCWSDNEEMFKDIELGSGTFSIVNQLDSKAAGNIKYGLIDEERKININTANKDILVSLLMIKGCSVLKANELADCIIDWRDKDSKVRKYGAEDNYYNSLEIPYNCKDADFESIEELMLVKGMNEELFCQIKDDLTVFGNGQVNINTANRDILISIGMGPILAEKIISYRLGFDGLPMTLDDRAFEDVEDIKQELDLSETEMEIINSLITSGFITTKSDNFKFIACGKLSNNETTSKIVCVVDRAGVIKYWRED